ncbi:MAG: exodeoxyribonuclease V subunit gamma [Ignavibacteria bacterium]|nr:exodeoxyribonuclease V subunit gamma [Ignavibacteria bacterium]
MILSKPAVDSVDLSELIWKALSENTLGEFLFIVPTNRRAHQLKLEILQNAPNRAIHPLHIKTLLTLSRALLTEMGDVTPLITEPAGVLLLKQCFRELHDLRYFSRYKDYLPEGFLRILRAMFTEWKRQLLSAEQIEAQLNTNVAVFEHVKATEIIQIYSLYCEKLASLHRYETGDAYQAVLNNKEKFLFAFDRAFSSTKTIVITGYSEFSSPEIELLNYCAEQTNRQMFIEMDYHENNVVLFGHLQDGVTELKNKGFSISAPVKPPELHSFIEFLRNNLFLYRGKGQKDRRFSDYLHVSQVANAEEEVKHLAMQIRTLLKDKQNSAADICVLFQGIGEYAPLVREIFPRYGIPFNLTDRPLLSSSVVVNAIINYLQLENSDYYFRHVLRAFSTSFIQPQFCSFDDILLTASNYRITGGLNEWITAHDREPYDDDDFLSDEVIQAAVRCSKEIERVHLELQVFHQNLTPAQFLTHFVKFVSSLQLQAGVNRQSLHELQLIVSAVNALVDTVQEVCSILEAERGPATTFRSGHIINEILSTVGNTRYTLPGQPYDTVLVTTPEEVRGLSYKHVFIGGLYDGNFPFRYSPEIFSPEALSRDEKRYIAEQQYLFYQALCCGKFLYFSIPQSDGEKYLNASHLFSSLTHIAEITARESMVNSAVVTDKLDIISSLSYGNDDCSNAAIPEDFFSFTSEQLRNDFLTDFIRINRQPSAQEYNGILNLERLDDKSRETLADYYSKEYSISQLETYAACPMRFFLERIMGIQIQQEPEEDATRMEFGSLLHKILFQFMVWVKQENIRLFQANDSLKNTVSAKLFSIAEELIEFTPTGKALTEWDKELLLGIEGSRDASILSKFLEIEFANPFSPYLFEASFGTLTPQAAASSSFHSVGAIEIEGVKLRGKIDRVDIDSVNRSFNVLDYKTGKNKYTKNAVNQGLQLQLPVYMAVVRTLLAEANPDFSSYLPLYPIIFSLAYQKKNFGWNSIIAKPNEMISGEINAEHAAKTEKMILQTAKYIRSYVDAIISGNFAHTSLSGTLNTQFACTFCELGSVCRVSEFNSRGEVPAPDSSQEE